MLRNASSNYYLVYVVCWYKIKVIILLININVILWKEDNIPQLGSLMLILVLHILPTLLKSPISLMGSLPSLDNFSTSKTKHDNNK